MISTGIDARKKVCLKFASAYGLETWEKSDIIWLGFFA